MTRCPVAPVVLAVALLVSAPARADDEPWRGSGFGYRTTIGTAGLDKGQDITWNPYVASTFGLSPRWHLGDLLVLGADVDWTREHTQADGTTFADETLIGDVKGTVAATGLVKVPWVGIDIGLGLEVTAPTSKASQARTLLLGLGAGLDLSRSFDLLEGIQLGWTSRMARRFHRYTTSERATPLVPGCLSATGGCDAFLNTGLRNSQWRMVHAASLQVSVTRWLSASVASGTVTDWLYGLADTPEAASFTPQEAPKARYASFFEASLGLSLGGAMDIALGLVTSSPQLAPDSSFYNPFYNRHSAVFLDLRCDLDGVVSQIFDDDNTEP